METYVVVSHPQDWPLDLPGVHVISSRDYLTDSHFSELSNIRLFNLCRSYKYQTLGYYVSLLAEARGHKIIPSVTTIQDFKSLSIIRGISVEIEELIQKNLHSIQSKEFVLSIYFGKNLAKKYDRLAIQLFNLFQAPFLRAKFVRDKEGIWGLQNIEPISASAIPENHQEFVLEVAKEYFSKGKFSAPKRSLAKYDLAVLVNPEEEEPPSDEGFIKRLTKAAAQFSMSVDVITRDDYSRLAEYDALFIRETTSVNHYTYRFSRKAQTEGLVVVDDPVSILKCANKVYLAELLGRHEIPTPKTMIVQKDNAGEILKNLNLPCILKQPDSSFSLGVEKVKTEAELAERVAFYLDKSELILCQEFLPTPYDWRVGVLQNEPLYVCKYYMAKGHWQILNWEKADHRRYGKVETLPLWKAPDAVVETALEATALIGDGLYGVDLKETESGAVVIEVNDNPNLESGYEDKALKEKLYEKLVKYFIEKIEALWGDRTLTP